MFRGLGGPTTSSNILSEMGSSFNGLSGAGAGLGFGGPGQGGFGMGAPGGQDFFSSFLAQMGMGGGFNSGFNDMGMGGGNPIMNLLQMVFGGGGAGGFGFGNESPQQYAQGPYAQGGPPPGYAQEGYGRSPEYGGGMDGIRGRQFDGGAGEFRGQEAAGGMQIDPELGIYDDAA